MNDIKKIAILGGTGKAGKYLVNQLISYGFHLKLLLRNPENFQVENSVLEIVDSMPESTNPLKACLPIVRQ